MTELTQIIPPKRLNTGFRGAICTKPSVLARGTRAPGRQQRSARPRLEVGMSSFRFFLLFSRFLTHRGQETIPELMSKESQLSKEARPSVGGTSAIWHCTQIAVAHSTCHRNGVRREALIGKGSDSAQWQVGSCSDAFCPTLGIVDRHGVSIWPS